MKTNKADALVGGIRFVIVWLVIFDEIVFYLYSQFDNPYSIN